MTRVLVPITVRMVMVMLVAVLMSMAVLMVMVMVMKVVLIMLLVVSGLQNVFSVTRVGATNRIEFRLNFLHVRAKT